MALFTTSAQVCCLNQAIQLRLDFLPVFMQPDRCFVGRVLRPLRTIHHFNDTFPELEGDIHHDKAVGAGVFWGIFPAVFSVPQVGNTGIVIITDFMTNYSGHGFLLREVDVLPDAAYLLANTADMVQMEAIRPLRKSPECPGSFSGGFRSGS